MTLVPGFPMYSVTPEGRVYSHFSERWLRPSLASTGYLTLTLCNENGKRSFCLHQVVALAFLGTPTEGQEVNHRDGNKRNCHFKNLEWISRSGNHLHALRNGLRAHGEGSSVHKLKSHQVLEIRALKGKMNQYDVAAQFGISQATVWRIQHGRTWKYLAA